MDRWKSTARKKISHGESQKGGDKRWRRSETEKVRREKTQVREKVGKSRKIKGPDNPTRVAICVGKAGV